MKKNSFHKTERLKSRKSIESLFKEGSVHKAYPFIVLYRVAEDLKFPALMTVAVPKRQIRNASDRNLIKRRAREVYRQRKSELYEVLSKQNKMMELLFLYQSHQVEEFKTIERGIDKLVKKISSQ